MNWEHKILIVDDNRFIQDALRVIIGLMGNLQLVGVANNGIEAIEMARLHAPDIILMDINMNEVNGFEATRQIILENPDAKVLGLSLHTEPSYVRKMIAIGARGYVSKSANPQEMMEAIRTVVSGGNYIDKTLAGYI